MVNGKRILPPLLFIATTVLLSLTACSSIGNTGTSGSAVIEGPSTSKAELPLNDPGIRGTITKSESLAGSLSILVEENPSDLSGSQKASVRINDKTGIYRRAGSDLLRVDRALLSPGEKVSVWFEGPVAESYPVQGTAAAILLES